jgi:DNA processing protein
LKEVKQFPPLLYYRGILNPEEPCVAIVGSRKPTDYGKAAAKDFSAALSQAGFTVVSGLAYGIDAAAHTGATQISGRTIAVLAGGLDDPSLSPGRNRKLAGDIIAAGGAIIGEHPPRTASIPQNFVVRNRIIAGLSLGTVIIECTENSGALITAEHARREKRKTYALPGSIYSDLSKGTHYLIKNGLAELVTEPKEIIEGLSMSPESSAKLELPTGLSAVEEQVLSLLSSPLFIDDIVAATALPAAVIMSALTILEMRSLIKSVGLQQYGKVKK